MRFGAVTRLGFVIGRSREVPLSGSAVSALVSVHLAFWMLVFRTASRKRPNQQVTSFQRPAIFCRLPVLPRQSLASLPVVPSLESQACGAGFGAGFAVTCCTLLHRIAGIQNMKSQGFRTLQRIAVSCTRSGRLKRPLLYH